MEPIAPCWPSLSHVGPIFSPWAKKVITNENPIKNSFFWTGAHVGLSLAYVGPRLGHLESCQPLYSPMLGWYLAYLGLCWTTLSHVSSKDRRICRWGCLANWSVGLIHHCGVMAADRAQKDVCCGSCKTERKKVDIQTDGQTDRRTDRQWVIEWVSEWVSELVS